MTANTQSLARLRWHGGSKLGSFERDLEGEIDLKYVRTYVPSSLLAVVAAFIDPTRKKREHKKPASTFPPSLLRAYEKRTEAKKKEATRTNQVDQVEAVKILI